MQIFLTLQTTTVPQRQVCLLGLLRTNAELKADLLSKNSSNLPRTEIPIKRSGFGSIGNIHLKHQVKVKWEETLGNTWSSKKEKGKEQSLKEILQTERGDKEWTELWEWGKTWELKPELCENEKQM